MLLNTVNIAPKEETIISQVINISPNHSFFLRWEDCAFIFNKIRSGSLSHSLKEQLINYFRPLDHLKHQYLWTKENDQIQRLTLWDIYEQVSPFSGKESLTKNKLYSLVGPRGPYHSYHALELMNADRLRRFFSWKVYIGEIQPREFRLSAHNQLLMLSQKSRQSSLLSLRQIGTKGLLIAVPKSKIHHNDSWTIFLNTQFLPKVMKNPIEMYQNQMLPHPFYTHREQESFTIEVKNILWQDSLFSTDQTQFGFISFQELNAQNQWFTTQIRNQIEEFHSAIKRVF